MEWRWRMTSLRVAYHRWSLATAQTLMRDLRTSNGTGIPARNAAVWKLLPEIVDIGRAVFQFIAHLKLRQDGYTQSKINWIEWSKI
jgi:hypothetical protein